MESTKMRVTGTFEFRLPFVVFPPVELREPFSEISDSFHVETIINPEPYEKDRATSREKYHMKERTNQELSNIVNLEIQFNSEKIVIKIPFSKKSTWIIPTNIVVVEVTRELSKTTINNIENWRHAQKIQQYYSDALRYLGFFLERFRYRTRNYYIKSFHYRATAEESEVGSAPGGWSRDDAFRIFVDLEDKVAFKGSTWFDDQGKPIENLNKFPMLRQVVLHDFQWHRNYIEEDLFLVQNDMQVGNSQQSEEHSVKLLSEEMILYAMEACHKNWIVFEGMDEDDKILLQRTVVNVALMNIAIACETYIKYFVARQGRALHKRILEKYREFQIPVIEYLDVILKDIQKSSLKEENLILFENIKLLFEIRNKIAHQGWAFIKERGKNYPINDLGDVIDFASDAYALLDWLDRIESGNFLSKKSELLWSQYLNPGRKTRRQEIIGRDSFF